MKGAQDFPQMKIRLHPDIKEKIEESAKKNNRSLNAEIATRLNESFSGNSVTSEEIRQIIREELKKNV